MERRRHAAIASLAALGLAIGFVACGGDPATITPTVAPVAVRLTTDAQPATACMDALITGTLVPNDAWGVALRPAGNGPLLRPVFPFGYSAVLDGVRVAVLDERGQVVARTGDTIQSGGGLIDNVRVSLCGGITVISR